MLHSWPALLRTQEAMIALGGPSAAASPDGSKQGKSTSWNWKNVMRPEVMEEGRRTGLVRA